MGHAIESTSTGLSMVVNNLNYVVITFLTTLIVGGISLVLGIIPIVGPLLTGVFLAPVMIAGVYGMAHAIETRGRTSASDFTDSVGESYLNLVGVNLIISLITGALAVAFLIIFVAYVFMASFSLSDATPSGIAALGVTALAIIAIFGVLFALILMFLQFADAAVVADGAGVMDAISQSVGLARANFLSVLGYTILRGVASVVAVAIVGIFAAAGAMVDALPVLVLAGVGALVSFPALYAFLPAFHISYYSSITEPATSASEDTSPRWS